jgi:hypothetical protein
VRVVEVECQRYTAYIPEGPLDRFVLRFIPGLERVQIGIFVLRDSIAGIGDGTCLVRRWSGKDICTRSDCPRTCTHRNRDGKRCKDCRVYLG